MKLKIIDSFTVNADSCTPMIKPSVRSNTEYKFIEDDPVEFNRLKEFSRKIGEFLDAVGFPKRNKAGEWIESGDSEY